ncbi:iron export ABC transporter permease subunit FetB [Aerococcaceae bacterium zg-BR9]|uniref:ABC transporter permease n=1 Tax=Aerococcaceae bacterium zg-1292 TaxID=2774330 RepID=UPI0040627DC4|nr:iron export ABC transporter permease subunit FetB [Aerococcaceae bacterium zg-BR9]
MSNDLQASPLSLMLSFSLVLIAIGISYREKLKLEKEIVWAVIRMVVQLIAVAYVLGYVFKLDNGWLTSLMILVIIMIASLNAANRGKGLHRPLLISFIALASTTVLTLSILVLSGNLKFIPAQMIPITGMIVGNSMKSVGLVYANLFQLFRDQEQAVLEKISLGATPYQAAHNVLQMTIKQGIQPTVDGIKTTGIVSLPGMMSGSMLAGVAPLKAILYQIMVMFMIIGATSFAMLIATYLAYRSFFTERYQLSTQLRKRKI